MLAGALDACVKLSRVAHEDVARDTAAALASFSANGDLHVDGFPREAFNALYERLARCAYAYPVCPLLPFGLLVTRMCPDARVHTRMRFSCGLPPYDIFKRAPGTSSRGPRSTSASVTP